jgi:hypothetical protein
MKSIVLTLLAALALFGVCGFDGFGTGDDQIFGGGKVWNVGDSMNDSGWVAPVYWKNGKIVELSRISDTRPGYADDITIHNGDIYVAGETFTGTAEDPAAGVACYWKNGQRFDLPKPPEAEILDAIATGIAIVKHSVHVGGGVGNEYQVGVPVYWKDGVLTKLPVVDESCGGLVLGMHVSHNDIYYYGFVVVWGEDGLMKEIPAYWKNGTLVRLSLPEGYQGEVHDLKVSNGSVYTGGEVYTFVDQAKMEKAVYWKDDVMTALTALDGNDNAVSNGLDVYKHVVYSAGYFFEGTWYTPNIWKDTTRHRLSMIDEAMFGEAHDVEVVEGKVFVTGWTYVQSKQDPNISIPIACNWVNGKRSDLPGLAKDPQSVWPKTANTPRWFGLWSGVANAPRWIRESTRTEGASRRILVQQDYCRGGGVWRPDGAIPDEWPWPWE